MILLCLSWRECRSIRSQRSLAVRAYRDTPHTPSGHLTKGGGPAPSILEIKWKLGYALLSYHSICLTRDGVRRKIAALHYFYTFPSATNALSGIRGAFVCLSQKSIAGYGSFRENGSNWP